MNLNKNKIEQLIKINLHEIFKKEGKYILPNTIISVIDVNISNDISIAKVSLSLYNNKSKIDLEQLRLSQKKIKYLLGIKIRKKIRKIPILKFYIDHSYEQLQKIDDILDGKFDKVIKI